jgi:beta-glucosidase
MSLSIPAAAFSHSAVEAAPRNDEWWKNRQATLNQRAAEAGGKAELIFIGDSITQGWEGEGKEVWTRYYAPRNALNLGIGGDRTQHVLWRLENGNLKGLKPKAAVVMIGTNNSNGEDNSVEQIAEGVAAIVQSLQRQLPDTKILLLGIFPRGENPNPQRGKVLQVNQVISKLADGQKVIWIDFGALFVDAKGNIPRDLMPDYLHLSPAGYELWAKAIEPKLTEILGGGAVAAQSGGLTGKWTFSTPGPDGQPVSFPMVLKQEGNVVTGQFARGDGKWLEIRDGRVNGSEFSWTVKRDRPSGGDMVYQMKGRLEGNQLSGETKTDFDGNPVSSAWTAKREP